MKHEHHEKESSATALFGFWVYVMTDCVLFATLFATYGVLRNATAGAATSQEVISLPFVLAETMILLVSSLTCGIAMLAAHQGKKRAVISWFSITFLLGLVFLGMELSEFRGLLHEGASWQASAYLSAYFTLVGTHGLHILFGLLWIAVLLHQVWRRGLAVQTVGRLALLSLFWHFLDIIWIFIFTMVYLMGSL